LILEGGALVLADRGVCLIDEFDKMNLHDQVYIHAVMDQQCLSIGLAGIVTTRQARCAVIAAANPIGGRYDPSRSLYDIVELHARILGNFDILCVLQDTVDPMMDGKLADFVLSSQMKSNINLDGNGHGQVPSTEADDNDGFTQDLLRKYIVYSKQSCDPHLNPEQAEVSKILDFYRQLRSHCIQIRIPFSFQSSPHL
jgi:DNA replication licensing factor MCM2